MPIELTKDGMRYVPDGIEYVEYVDDKGGRYAAKRWMPEFPTYVAVTMCKNCIYRQREV